MNTVKCPNCDNENINTNIRCEKCNKQLITKEQMQDDISLNPSLNLTQDPIKNAKIELYTKVMGAIITIVVGIIFCYNMFIPLFQESNNFANIILIPFLICGIIILICGIFIIIKGISTKKNIDAYVKGNLNIDKVEKNEKNFEKVGFILNNIYVFVFLLFWFGYLIVADISALKTWSDGGNQMFFFTKIFWIVGINILIHKLKNKRYKKTSM